MTKKKTDSGLSVKVLVYIAIMAALGTALAILSIDLLPLAPTQIALDLSHLGTFLSAIPGGAIIGAITGALVGIYPGFAFGYTHGTLGIVGLVSLPAGKALAGFTCGILQRYIKRPLLSVTVGYVPESLFTLWLFMSIVPIITGMPYEVAFGIVIGILTKAWIEILFLGFIMESVFLSRGVVSLLRTIFPKFDFQPLTEM